MTGINSLDLSHSIMCGELKAVGEPTVMDLLVANASTGLHFKIMRPIMRAIKEI